MILNAVVGASLAVVLILGGVPANTRQFWGIFVAIAFIVAVMQAILERR